MSRARLPESHSRAGIGRFVLALVFLAPGCSTTNPESAQDELRRPPLDRVVAAELAGRRNQTTGSLLELAESGDREAQYQLGMNYYYGIGVSKSRDLAEYWVGQAAQQGSSEARQMHAALQRASKPAPTEEPPKPEPEPARDLPRTETKTAASQPRNSVVYTGEWILGQPGSHYTIQLLGGQNWQSIDRFIRGRKAPGQLAYYRTRRNGKDWYSVLLGSFADQSSATRVLKTLSADWLQAGPWVRPFGEVQAIIISAENASASPRTNGKTH